MDRQGTMNKDLDYSETDGYQPKTVTTRNEKHSESKKPLTSVEQRKMMVQNFIQKTLESHRKDKKQGEDKPLTFKELFQK